MENAGKCIARSREGREGREGGSGRSGGLGRTVGRTSGQRGREEGREGGGGYGSEGRRRKEPQRWPGGAEHARTHSAAAAAARAFLSLSPSPYTHSAPLQAARRRPPPPNLSLRCLFFAQSDFPSPPAPAASLLPHVPNRLPVATTTAAPECVGTHSSSPPGPAADVAEYDEEGRRGESSSPFPSHLPPYLHRLRARGAWLC